MRRFYAFWFFFCAGWGYVSASFPSESSPDWLQAAVAFPSALFTAIAVLWVELRKVPAGALSPRPTLKLKPWDMPMGLAIFMGLTFTFSGIWGAAMSMVGDFPSPDVALRFLAMGAGLLGGCHVMPRIFPDKFGA